ncbi:E3 ubiquitin-protein ligase TRIM33 [Patella vulgata]|uniref:E3 ubiquitin-protein ligase TRIM33 n=1 Tax=Patella vulgata TaxID=6465 RepID=UPI0024A8FCB7|nr:E3 ubiquitin-protein ligase TRIM33 [Patella vulgata]
MAEQTDKEVCSICLYDFKHPVKIDCQHSFCFICLEDYVNKTSAKDQFQCPLCRCLINVGDRGVQLNTEANSTINIPKCDVCTEDTSQYFCRDCDQYLCNSCRTMHDKIKICKDHVVCRYDENQIDEQSRSNETKKEKRPVNLFTNPKDFCPNHESEKVTTYCKDCTLAMCLKCFVANHNGHNYLDLQKDEVRQNMRQDLRTLNDALKTQIDRFEKHNDNLNSKLIEVKHFIKTECDKVDAQMDKICSDVRRIGQNIKKKMQETSEEEESKLGKLTEDIKRLTEDLKASVKYSENILEDSSIVEVLKRLPKVRQEKDESCCRKLDIPDVRYSKFQVAEIDQTLLTNHLGKIVNCYQNMFEDIFNVDTVSSGWCSGKQHVVSGFTWSIAVVIDSLSLFVKLYLDDVEDNSITLCDADVTYKVINKTDDRQSVVKQFIGGVSAWCDIIDWSYFSDPVNGFTDDDGNFKIQVTINEVTDIERCAELC